MDLFGVEVTLKNELAKKFVIADEMIGRLNH